MKISREWAMPNADTFSVKPIGLFVDRWLKPGMFSIDPFARNCTRATVTNDLNPDTAAMFHLDAEEFVRIGVRERQHVDLVLFDPPYSPRQISECYQQIGREVTAKDTQNAVLYKRVRDAIDELLRPGGIVLSFGWSSNGMGKSRRYELEEILLVCHGGAHNDTICIAERKL